MAMIKRKWLLVLLVALALLTAACAQDGQALPPSTPDQTGDAQSAETAATDQPVGAMQLTVYYANADATRLKADIRTVPASTHPMQTALQLLIAGSDQPDLLGVVPQGTTLLGVWVKDGIAYVNFSRQLVTNSSGGSAGELLLVGAIVNTLTEFDSVEKVQLLVDGRQIETISGHLDTSTPLSRSEAMIQKN